MARVTIVFSDEEEGYELTAECTYEPEVSILMDDYGEPDMRQEMSAPVRASFIALQAVNALSESGGADIKELNDGEVKFPTGPRRPSVGPEFGEPWGT